MGKIEKIKSWFSQFGEFLVYSAGALPNYMMRLSHALVNPFVGKQAIGFLISSLLSAVMYSVFYMFDDLFKTTFSIDASVSYMAGILTIGTMLLLAMIIAYSDNNALKGLSAILIPLYLVIINLIIVSYVATKAVSNIVGDDIKKLGLAIAYFLMGINVIPALLMALVYRTSKKFATMTEASAEYFGILVKTIVIGASGAANVYYGMHLKIPVYVAFLCGFLLEACLVWASVKMASESKKTGNERDSFDLGLWTIVQWFVAILLCIVSVQTVAELSGLQNTFIFKYINFGAEIYLSIIAVTLFAIVSTQTLTAWINYNPSTGWTTNKLGDAARNGVNNAANAAGKIGNAVSGVLGGAASKIGSAIGNMGGSQRVTSLNKDATAPRTFQTQALGRQMPKPADNDEDEDEEGDDDDEVDGNDMVRRVNGLGVNGGANPK